MTKIFRSLISSQVWLSRHFDELLPSQYTMDGNQDFVSSFVPGYLRNGLNIYDIGGGKNPYLDHELKQSLGATVTGLDIDQAELDQAPQGLYDNIICTDITSFAGSGDADLVICQAVLEHVTDTEKALISIMSILKPGGLALLFIPSRNSAFARLNLLLPQPVKLKLLQAIYPESARNQGFRAYYDRCTPRDFDMFASSLGFTITDQRYYYCSSYFTFCFPLHLLWRMWVLVFHLLLKEQASETFTLALRKNCP